jgi:hypothetical protein
MKIKSMKMAARSGSMRCPICNEPRLLVEHHIHGRDIIEKNRLWNRCWICASCHDEVHSGKIVLEGWISTTEGKNLIWRTQIEAPIANDGAMPKLYDKSNSSII